MLVSFKTRRASTAGFLIRLELQAAFAGGVGEGLDPAVVLAPAAVERDLRDAGRFGAVGDRAADELGGGDVAAVLQLPAHLAARRGGRRQRAAGEVVDELRVNVLVAAEHRQPRTLR